MALPAILGALTRAISSLGGITKTLGGAVGGKQLLTDLKYGFTQNIGIRLSSQMGGMISGIDELEKVLLMNGTTLSKFNKDLGTEFKNLNGSTLTNLKNAANLYSIGFRDNNKSLLKVASIFDMTGQDTRGLLSVLPNLAFNLKLTSDGVNDLAITTLATGEKYGVATDRLINIISKLPVFKIAAQAGLDQFGKNLTDIIARLGDFGGSIGGVVNSLLTTEEGLRLSVAAGAGELRKQFEKAKGPEEAFKILMEIFRKVDAFAGPVRDQMKALGESHIGAIMGTQLLEKTYGPLMMQMLGMTGSLESFTLKINENAGKVDYTATLFTAAAELGNEFLPLYEGSLVVLVEITKYITALVQSFKAVANNMFQVGGFFDTMYEELVKPVGTGLGILYEMIMNGAKAIGSLVDWIMGMLPQWAQFTVKGLGVGLGASLAAANPFLALGGAAFLLSQDATQRKIANDTKRTADAAERQKELAEKEDRRVSAPTASSPGLTTMQMINRELMYAVTAMRIDERTSQQTANEQTNLLKMLVRNQARGLAGDTSVPTKTRGGL